MVERTVSDAEQLREEFGKLYEEHSGRLLRAAVKMTGSADAAEELVAEAFSRAYRKFGTFRHESSFSTWMHRILFNLIYDAASHVTEELPEIMPATASTMPDVLFESRYLGAKIDESIARLTDQQRQVFLLKELEGMKHAEIGARLGISESTSKVHYFNAMKRLREELNDYV